MADYFDSGAKTVENEFESNKPESEDESNDHEYFDNLPPLEENGTDPTCVKNSETAVSENSSGVEPHALADQDVVDSNTSAQDVHRSSEESDSTKSSTDSASAVESDEYVFCEVEDEISDSDVAQMMQKFKEEDYSATRDDGALMIDKCRLLYKRDYRCEEVDNSGGVLCENYPSRLIIPVEEISREERTEGLNKVTFDSKSYTEKTKKCNASRLRKRFVTPVIMFDKKFICRSGTITVRKTAAYEIAFQYRYPQVKNVEEGPTERFVRDGIQIAYDGVTSGIEAAAHLLNPDSVENLRQIDAQIIKDLKVQYICDLMIEDRKKVTGVSLSSSEKNNPDIYCDCNIEQMPYPGCEFFERYHSANRIPEGLIFNWERPDANTELKLSENLEENFLGIAWNEYKTWDLVELTKNYMKILLLYLAKGTGGLLVHCVSGWDRTPLFISILRVSMWADGVIHQKLDYKEMAYLTLTYDWYLFSHNLRNRLQKKEEIMHFCFKFLTYIASDEFSLTRIFHELPIEQREGRSLPDFQAGIRSPAINELCTYVLNIYDQHLSCEF